MLTLATSCSYLPTIKVDTANIGGHLRILTLLDEKDGRLAGAIAALETWATATDHELAIEDASALALRPCLGCFGCWTKTPGICAITTDDGRLFLEAFVRSDVLVTFTKIRYGSYAPSIKRALDRSIGFLLPYFTIHEGEMHHRQRYPWKRRILHIPYGGHDAEEFDTFSELARAHCDNALCLPVREQIDYQGDQAALMSWLQMELAR